MIPSRTWFPMNLQDRAAWFLNFAKQFADVAISGDQHRAVKSRLYDTEPSGGVFRIRILRRDRRIKQRRRVTWSAGKRVRQKADDDEEGRSEASNVFHNQTSTRITR